MREHDLAVDPSELLAGVVEQLVVTRRVLTLHHPIRAAVIDGAPADLDAAASPASVTISVHRIRAVARSLGESRPGGVP